MSGDTWVAVCAAVDVPEDGTLSAVAAGVPVALYNVGGTLHATQAFCTHGNAELVEGFIENGEIICPFHGGRFDIASGRPTALPCEVPLVVYETRVDDGKLFVRLEGDTE